MQALATIALLGLAAAVALWRSEAEPNRPAREPDHEWGEASGGLRSSIALRSTTACPKGPIVVEYRVKNVSDRKQTVWHSGFWPDHRIEVIAPSGKSAQMTEAGERAREAFSPGGIREKTVPVELAPGQIDDAWQAYDLRTYFLFDVQGEYAVQYIYQPGANLVVRSNVLRIAVNECR